jgi:hypothetical protein
MTAEPVPDEELPTEAAALTIELQIQEQSLLEQVITATRGKLLTLRARRGERALP